MKNASIPVKYLAAAALFAAIVLGLIKLDVWYATQQSSSADDGTATPDNSTNEPNNASDVQTVEATP
jgi:hypothetical protein